MIQVKLERGRRSAQLNAKFHFEKKQSKKFVRFICMHRFV